MIIHILKIQTKSSPLSEENHGRKSILKHVKNQLLIRLY